MGKAVQTHSRSGNYPSNTNSTWCSCFWDLRGDKCVESICGRLPRACCLMALISRPHRCRNRIHLFLREPLIENHKFRGHIILKGNSEISTKELLFSSNLCCMFPMPQFCAQHLDQYPRLQQLYPGNAEQTWMSLLFSSLHLYIHLFGVA